jgi:hypothetical protein
MRCFGSRPTARAAASALRRPGGRSISLGAGRRPVKPERPRPAAARARQFAGPHPALRRPPAWHFAGRLPEHSHSLNAPQAGSLGCGQPHPVQGRAREPRLAHETTQGDRVTRVTGTGAGNVFHNLWIDLWTVVGARGEQS